MLNFNFLAYSKIYVVFFKNYVYKIWQIELENTSIVNLY